MRRIQVLRVTESHYGQCPDPVVELERTDVVLNAQVVSHQSGQSLSRTLIVVVEREVDDVG